MDEKSVFTKSIGLQMIRLSLAVLLVLITSCFNNKEEPENPEEPLGLLWEYSYSMKGWGPEAQPGLIGDSLILMTGDEYISCLLTDSGDVKWRYSVPGGNVSTIQNLLYDDLQFYGWQYRNGNKLFAVNIETGEENWSIDSAGYYENHGLGSEYYYSPYGTRFFKITLTGEVVETVKSTQPYRSLSYYNNKVYGGQGWPSGVHDRGRIICYDENTLDSLWSYDSPGGGFNMCYPVFDNGILYIGTVWGSNNKVFALNAETGDVVWETDVYSCYKIIMVGDTLFCTSSSSVYALDKNNGNLLWRTTVFNPDESSPITYWDGYVYHPHYGKLYILNGETGEIVHKMRGPDEAPVEQVSAGASKIFVQSSQHLYAFTPYDPEKDNDQ